MNAIVTNLQPLNTFNYDDPALFRVLKETLYPGAQDTSVSMVLDYCRAARLDPMTKPVHIVPMYDSKLRCMKDVVMPGIGFYRTQASRTGEYVGIGEPEFGPEVTKTFTGTTEYDDRRGGKTTKTIDATVAYPLWCKVTIFRFIAGEPRAFTAMEFWDENYATQGKTDVPNSMWQKRRYGQLVKCTEAQALRKAFPELGSVPTADEMEGKSMSEGIIITQDGEIIGSQGQEGQKSQSPGTVTDLQGRINERKAAQLSGASAPSKQSPASSGTPSAPAASAAQTSTAAPGSTSHVPSEKASSKVNKLVADIAKAASEQDLEAIGKEAEKLQSEDDKTKVRIAYRIRLNELRKSSTGGNNQPMFT